MKGLYCKLDGTDDVKFVIQNRDAPSIIGKHEVQVQVKGCALSPVDLKLLKDLKLQTDVAPVGREIVGTVRQVGASVTFHQCNDEVVGIIPLGAEVSGLCGTVVLHEQLLVPKPERVNWASAAAAVRDGLKAYTALHTLAHMTVGQTLLVLDGASPFGVLAIQLAHYHGIKVLATAHSTDDQQFLEQLRPSVGRVIGVWDSKVDLVEACLEETGQLGLDIIIDAGVKLYDEEPESQQQRQLPHKHDIITMLGVGGHWVTMEENLQLDPPDAHSLFLKAASLSFLNDDVWTASGSHQGRYLHILKDIMDKLSTGTFRPLLEDPVPLYDATVSMEMIQKRQVRKRVVVQL